MKTVFILAALIFCFIQARSQSDSLKWAKEINEQVWKPFVSHPNLPQKKQTGERSFELRFDKRISNGAKAWESGYYKGTFTQDGKPPRSWYGRFFVVLTKEGGTWKILVDADTGKEANEENFSKASAMQ